MQAVLDAVDLCKVLVVDLLHRVLGELDGHWGRGVGAGDAEEGVKGVGAAFDLLDTAVLDDAEVQHTTVCGTDLVGSTVRMGYAKGEVSAYEDCVGDRTCAILELAVEELA